MMEVIKYEPSQDERRWMIRQQDFIRILREVNETSKKGGYSGPSDPIYDLIYAFVNMALFIKDHPETVNDAVRDYRW